MVWLRRILLKVIINSIQRNTAARFEMVKMHMNNTLPQKKNVDFCYKKGFFIGSLSTGRSFISQP